MEISTSSSPVFGRRNLLLWGSRGVLCSSTLPSSFIKCDSFSTRLLVLLASSQHLECPARKRWHIRVKKVLNVNALENRAAFCGPRNSTSTVCINYYGFGSEALMSALGFTVSTSSEVFVNHGPMDLDLLVFISCRVLPYYDANRVLRIINWQISCVDPKPKCFADDYERVCRRPIKIIHSFSIPCKTSASKAKVESLLQCMLCAYYRKGCEFAKKTLSPLSAAVLWAVFFMISQPRGDWAAQQQTYICL